MHYLTLDTNTWIYLANGTEPARQLKFIKEEVDKYNITILLPEIVINEWDKNKDKAVKQGGLKHFLDINEALKRIKQLLGDKGEKDYFNFLLDEEDEKDYFADFIEKFKTKKKEIEEAIADNINLIDNLFRHKTTEIIKIKDEVFIKAGQFALEKKAPFRNKNSFADALIIFSFIDFVKTKSIEGALFITYNTNDFCEEKEGNKYLHPDLEPEFTSSKSKFYKIVGEALNTIKKDIVSQEELAFIKVQQEEAERDKNERDVEYCQVCHEMGNYVYFGSAQELIDERFYANPLQEELEFAKDLPKTKIKQYSKTIEIGHCSWCNTEHFICVSCGCTNAVMDHEFNNRKECEYCSLPYIIDMSNDHDDIGEPQYRILKDVEICKKCGNEFEDNGNNICEMCEEDYSHEE